MTPTKTGMQMSRLNPKHLTTSTFCNKTRSFHLDGGEEITLRLLKFWAICSTNVDAKEEHEELWEECLAVHARGELPTTEELDRKAPMSWE